MSFRKRIAADTWIAIATAVCLFATFHPLNLWPLAWVAPVGWIHLARKEKLASSFRGLYLAGFVHWILLLHWVRLPHPALVFGWLALAAYLAVYIPLFIFATRSLTTKCSVPIVLAAPTVWAGLEFVRGYAFTGLSISLLSHTQIEFTTIVQLADTLGASGVSFLMIMVATSVEQLLFSKKRNSAALGLVVTATCFVGAMLYGTFKLDADASVEKNESQPTRVALIQGSFDTQFGNDPDVEEERSNGAFNDYRRLSVETIWKDSKIDLVIWPESMFSTRLPYITYEEPLHDRPDLDETATELLDSIQILQSSNEQDRQFVAQEVDSFLLVGSGRQHYFQDQTDHFNSALLLSEKGEILQIYDKRHPVMFGEYIPFARYFPWVYRYFPMGRGLAVGDQAVSIEVGNVKFMPMICFENTVPHLVRHQVLELNAKGKTPDCLVTITNDGWFWGSSLLDAHFACGVFRAIEMNRPMLIAANTGFSAVIDQNGRVLQKGARRAESVLVAALHQAEKDLSRYAIYGDWFGLIGGCITTFGLCVGLRRPSGAPNSQD